MAKVFQSDKKSSHHLCTGKLKTWTFKTEIHEVFIKRSKRVSFTLLILRYTLLKTLL